MIRRVYVDNSVIGGIHDPEFSHYSGVLFKEFRIGLYIPVISTLTESEIAAGAPEHVLKTFNELQKYAERVEPTDKAFELADHYLSEGKFTKRMRADCLHIATASVHSIPILTSWNFRDILNVDKIVIFHSINLKSGYPLLEIRNPRELIHEEDI